jgi:hypothetical protein
MALKLEDKFELRYRVDAASTTSSEKGARRGGRRRSYLHDHRTKDSLLEYLENLEE